MICYNNDIAKSIGKNSNVKLIKINNVKLIKYDGFCEDLLSVETCFSSCEE